MLFNSFDFVLFAIVVIGVAACLPTKGTAWRVLMVAASCIFYGQWSWKYLLLIAITASIDYSVARQLIASTRPLLLVTISIACNLAVLALFKYANFAIESYNGVAHATGWLTITPLDVVLPVGISFYTFQNMSYTIDVYRGELLARRSMLDYALFTTFFPQLLAGPIVRASEFFNQIDRPVELTAREINLSWVLIASGYVKKVVFADNLSLHVDEVFRAPELANAWFTLLSIYAFAFQIYFDFSGYTDIAIGLAMLLGVRFPKNFDYPYIAASFRDFWRRWHMTLSRWLRDYLYVSLGGNRRGATRTAANLMTTMLLGGLWHGASWNFVIWGGLHGAMLALERHYLAPTAFWKSEKLMQCSIRMIIVFHGVCFAWIFFRAPDFATTVSILAKLVSEYRLSDLLASSMLATAIAGFTAGHLLMGHYDAKNRIAAKGPVAMGLFLGSCVLALVLFAPAKSSPFIYFQF